MSHWVFVNVIEVQVILGLGCFKGNRAVIRALVFFIDFFVAVWAYECFLLFRVIFVVAATVISELLGEIFLVVVIPKRDVCVPSSF